MALPSGGQCEALIESQGPHFLPVTYAFPSLDCSGWQANSFTVPQGIPDGPVNVIWYAAIPSIEDVFLTKSRQCTGSDPFCIQAMVSGGFGGLALPLDNTGTAGCILESLQTASTTVQITEASSTVIRTVPTIFTTFSTSYLSTTAGATATTAADTTAGTTGATTAADTTAATTSTSTTTGSQTSTTPAAGTVTTTNHLSSTQVAKDASGSSPMSGGSSIFMENTAPGTTIGLSTAIAATVVSTLIITQTVTARACGDC